MADRSISSTADNWSSVCKGSSSFASPRRSWAGAAADLVKPAAIPGLGVAVGTLYPLLSRLRRSVQTRLEESSSGPARKYYTLTTEGHRTLLAMREHLASLLDGLGRLQLEEER